MGEINMNLLLISLLKETSEDFLISVVDTCWKYERGEISYNTDNNEKDLESGDGNTYSGEVWESNIDDTIQDTDYHLVHIDTHQGYIKTLLLNKNSRIFYD